MTIAELCLLAAVILTILSIVPAKLSGVREYDNGNLGDRPSLRSAVWSIGFACNLAIFFSPAWAGH
jgi:uncharacterized MAPEG superfamily protein